MTLYIFDLDDTLIEGYVKKHPYDRVEPLPGRADKLDELIKDDHDIAIVTNQGGVAFGYNTEDQFHSKMYTALFKLGLPVSTQYAVCFSDLRSKDERYNKTEDCARRKPSGAMIHEVMRYFGMLPQVPGSGALDNLVLYIGDRPEDQQAAINADVPFMWSWEFFGDPKPEGNG